MPFIILLLVFLSPPTVTAANLLDASALLGNGRTSFKSAISGSPKTGDRTISIKEDSSKPNQTTENLFTNDVVCFLNPATKACRGNRTYKIGKIIDSRSFTITSALETDLSSQDEIIVTQTGSLPFNFTMVAAIPPGGSIRVVIPSVDKDGETADGIPDTSTQARTSGFDLNSITSSDISTSGCGDENWDPVEAVSAGTAEENHIILIKRLGSFCPGGSEITIVIDGIPGILNPAPLLGTNDLGIAEKYNITIRTRDEAGSMLDTIDVNANPVGGLSVTATVGHDLFTLFGYTSPFAVVTLEGIGIFDKTTADKKGYFAFANRFSPLSWREPCLSAKDQFGRLTMPVCLPPFPTKIEANIGPVLLPPSISVDKKDYFMNDQVILSGQAIPNTEVDISVFVDENRSTFALVQGVSALTLPKLQAKADALGNYSLVIPSSYPEYFRIFGQSRFDRELSPKSNTINVKVLSIWMILLELLLALWNFVKDHLVEIMILLLILALTIYYLRKHLHPHPIARNRWLAIRESHAIFKPQQSIVEWEEHPLIKAEKRHKRAI